MTQEERIFNCYVGVIATTEEGARKDVLDTFYTPPIDLVHVEHSEEPEEGDTYVFSIYADVFDEDGDSDLLHDHYDLPNQLNLPYEAP